MLASPAALLTLAIPIPIAAQAGTDGQAPPAGVVSPKPPANVPHLPAVTSQVEQIRPLVQCGGSAAARQFIPLTIGSGTAAVIAVTTRGPFGEPERTAERWLPWLTWARPRRLPPSQSGC